MIEAVAPLSGVAAPPPAAEDGVTAGTLLRRAREAAGLHVAALAVSLKVPVRKLEALESDSYDLLADTVFVRALASSICRNLKIDPQPVLDRLPHGTAPRLIQDSDGLNAPFRGPRDGAAPSWPEQLSKPVILAVFGLLLGALVLILLPRMQASEEGAIPEAKPADAPAAESPAAAAREREAAPQPIATPSLMTAPSALVPASLPTPPVAPQTVVAAQSSGNAALQVPASAAGAGGIVVFQTKGQSWVEVTDAKGVVAFRKLMAAGETGAASGAVPLQVTVGRADVTEVQVRGKPFDLRPVSKDNVARFEVK
jgi:cytoskeleton protein RodZ